MQLNRLESLRAAKYSNGGRAKSKQKRGNVIAPVNMWNSGDIRDIAHVPFPQRFCGGSSARNEKVL